MSFGEQGMINVVDFLLTEYATHLAREGKTDFAREAETLKASAPLMLFRTFAKDYLANNRPTAITHAEANYIIQLTNAKKFAVSPAATAVAGSMQPSPFMCVTGQETAREMAASLRQGGMPGSFEVRVPQQSMEQGGPGFSFDQPRPYQKPDRV